MSEETKLPAWATERADICQKIRSTTSMLKIVLKTKNEAFLLQKWIDHHVQIAGPKNVIIMDNCSDDPAVLDLYARNDDRVSIFSYGGHHNSLHRIADFPEFYGALRDSCRFYVFIDTDEFLFWSEKDKLISGAEITKSLGTASSKEVFPGIWLHNYPGCDDIFFVSDYAERKAEGLAWGKPLVSSSVDVVGFINHNCQLKGSVRGLNAGYGLFVAHFNRLIPQQRINQNIQKLLSRKAIRRIEDIHDLLKSDTSTSADRNIDLYVREIKSLQSVKEGKWPKLTNPPAGTVKLGAGGTLIYPNDTVRDTFGSIQTEFMTLWSNVPEVSS